MNRASAAAAHSFARAIRALTFALVLVVVPLASAQDDQGRGRAAPPLQSFGPQRVLLRAPVDELAADGSRVAWLFCQRKLVSWWRPGTSQGSGLGPPASFACPPQTSPYTYYSLALAGTRVAWAQNEGGIQTNSAVFLADATHPTTIRLVAQKSACCRGNALGEGRLGFVVGQAGLIAFTRWELCGDPGAPPCTVVPAIDDSFVERVLQPTATGTGCPGTSWPCHQLAAGNGLLGSISAYSGRAALLHDNGAIDIVAASGAAIRHFPALAGQTRAADLWGTHLVVLVPGKVIDFSVLTGQALQSRSVPAVSSGGPCFRLPCPAPLLRLEDFARGLVAYTLHGKVRVLRLSDGHDRVVARGTAARFVDSGLVYAYVGTGAWPAGVRWVTNARLAQILH